MLQIDRNMGDHKIRDGDERIKGVVDLYECMDIS